ncbi:MAG: DUF1963 domain-containing protein [Hyphomicrobiaceae bacterium]
MAARKLPTPSNTKAGGLPSLSPDTPWPSHLVTGTPLHFLAQVDLASLKNLGKTASGKAVASTLPSEGLLLFFADMAETYHEFGARRDGLAVATRVVFTSAPGIERAAPVTMPNIAHTIGKMSGEDDPIDATVFDRNALVAYAVDTYHGFDPGYFDRRLNRSDSTRMKGLRDELNFLAFEKLGLSQQIGEADDSTSARFKILGAPEGEDWAEAATARKEGRVLLLEFSGRDLAPVSGVFEEGLFQFWISPEDLTARRFERAWATANFT